MKDFPTDEGFCLTKAQEAEALADASTSLVVRDTWEAIAKEYRLLAHALAEIHRSDAKAREHPPADV
jgi:hypothetical protein